MAYEVDAPRPGFFSRVGTRVSNAEFTILVKIFFWRWLLAFTALFALYNPWLSLYTWVVPPDHHGLADFQGQPYWLMLVKALVVLLVIGFIWMAASHAHRALGGRGIFFWVVILAIVSALLFLVPAVPPMAWFALPLDLTWKHVFYILYFLWFPIILGLGMTEGAIFRWMNNMPLITPTSPIHGHDHAAQASQAAHHVGHGH